MGGSGEGKDSVLGRTVAGKFLIDTLMGFGNVGTVYRATHKQLKRPVALKVLKGSLAADPTARARFSREAQLASQLDHVNIVKVYDYGTESDGLTYLVMELLEGRDLTDVIAKEAPLSLDRLVGIFAQVLSALAVAHRMGIVHRDLKPDNIMLVERPGEDGQPMEVVKVTDFGIAKTFGSSVGDSQPISTIGTVNGTPEYMSPEQAQGEALDGRADLYACGVVLYEMLVGEVPFSAASPLQVLNYHIEKPVDPPSQRKSGVDRRLEPVIMRALAKKREDRFPDAASMRAAMLGVLAESEPTLSLDEAKSIPAVDAVNVERLKEATAPTVLAEAPKALTKRVKQRRRSAGRAAFLTVLLGVTVVSFFAVAAMFRRMSPQTAAVHAAVTDAGVAADAHSTTATSATPSMRATGPRRGAISRPVRLVHPVHDARVVHHADAGR